MNPSLLKEAANYLKHLQVIYSNWSVHELRIKKFGEKLNLELESGEGENVVKVLVKLTGLRVPGLK